MASVLFIGGVSPEITQEEIQVAFAQHAKLLSSCVIRNVADGRCVGHAYVTVLNEDVPKAITVTEVGSNAVCVFPVDVEAWTAPVQEGAPAGAGAGACGLVGPTYGSGGGGGPAPVSVPVPMPVATPAAVGATADQVGSSGHVHLQEVMDLLRAHVANNNMLMYNGKPYYMLLNEACQKRQMTLRVTEASEGSMFGFIINVMGPNGAVCSGRGAGANKKDAKHNAAADCLEKLLASRQVPAAELLAAMTCAAPPGAAAAAAAGVPDGIVAVVVGGGGGGGGGSLTSAAAATAAAQTQSLMRLGLYPRCEEVMRHVHRSEAGRVKTVLMVLNEYAAKARLSVQHYSVPTQAGSGTPGGSFKFSTHLSEPSGGLVASAEGAELRSKQEAKQAAAAAMIEYLLARDITTLEALVRGGK